MNPTLLLAGPLMLVIGVVHSLLGKRLVFKRLRSSGWLALLRPDAKSQVMLRHADGKPHRIDTVVLPTQHSCDQSETPTTMKASFIEAVIEEIIKPGLPKVWLQVTKYPSTSTCGRAASSRCSTCCARSTRRTPLAATSAATNPSPRGTKVPTKLLHCTWRLALEATARGRGPKHAHGHCTAYPPAFSNKADASPRYAGGARPHSVSAEPVP